MTFADGGGAWRQFRPLSFRRIAMIPRIDTYEQARDYLVSRLDFERRPDAHPYDPTHYSLGRFAQLVERLGSPHTKFASIHIAGTKGKGSVAAMLEAGLLAAGLRTGLFTSPHLRDYPERIRVAGAPVAREVFAAGMRRLAPAVEADGFGGGEPTPYRTVFELLTALAFDVFAQAGLDMVVLETGLGGRLDCTNLVRPEVSILTTLALDHTRQLGDSLDKIAWEKGGIIKPGIPAVVSRQSAEAMRIAFPVLKRIAAECHAPLVEAPELLGVEQISENETGQVFSLHPRRSAPEPYRADLENARLHLRELRLGLIGLHQIENARTAAAAWAVLRAGGWNLPWEALRNGLASCRWPGRIEIYATRPRIIIDGAHCPCSANALAQTLRQLYCRAPRHFVFGIQRDKDHRGFIRALAERSRPEPQMEQAPEPKPADCQAASLPILSWSLYEAPGGRGAPCDQLAEALCEAGFSRESISLHPSAAAALENAMTIAREDHLVVACGTLYTVAALSDWAKGRVA